jgi:predicted dehydrogenase
LKEAEKLVSDMSGKIRLMVHENWRFRPQYRTIKSWIDEGRLGPLHSCSLTFRGSGFLPDAEGHRFALERQPFMQHEQYLMIREVMIHHLDVVRWLLGPLRLIGARAAKDVADIKGETRAAIFLETKDGLPVFVDGDMAAAGFPPRARDRFELSGGKGSIRFMENTVECLGASPETKTFDLDVAYQESFDLTLRHFTDCILDGGEFETDGVENLETLRLVEDAERSAGLR